MRVLCLLAVSLFLLCSCTVWQSSRLPDVTDNDAISADMYSQTRQSCERLFLRGNWQLVHSITFTMANGHGSSVIGVTVLDGERLKTGVMTVEGFVLFEAVLDKEKGLQVHRALPPFDNSEFALGLMGDVKSIFFLPSEQNPVVAKLDAGKSVCRYATANGQLVDVIPGVEGSSVLHVYGADQIRTKSIIVNDSRHIGNEGVPENIQLISQGMPGYTLQMVLISAERF